MELSEYDKSMIAIAEGGDPNDPAENKDEVVELPSEQVKEEPKDEPVEEPADDAKEGDTDEPKADDEKPEETDDDKSDEELTEDQKELQKLRQEQKERAVYDAIGGEESYKELAKWAGQNIPEAELAVYNQAVEQGDTDTAVFATKALQAMQKVSQYETHGYQGDVTIPSGDPLGSGPRGYESSAQMQADMNDPRYKTDEAYRNRVAQKIAMTSDFV